MRKAMDGKEAAKKINESLRERGAKAKNGEADKDMLERDAVEEQASKPWATTG